MSLAETREKCKAFITQIPRDVLIIVVLVLSSSASFGLGYLAAPVPTLTGSLSQPICEATGKFVASKNGTKYYLPSCSGVGKISEANKVWFVSEASARAAGYTPAANCDGL